MNATDEKKVNWRIIWDNKWNFVMIAAMVILYATIAGVLGYFLYTLIFVRDHVQVSSNEDPKVSSDKNVQKATFHDQEVFQKFSTCNDNDLEPIVNTTSGLLLGFKEVIVNRQVCSFLGIPFAQAPTGDLRFKKTVSKTPWQGVKKALKFGPSCVQKLPPQVSNFVDIVSFETSEDCLFMNIWTPRIISSSKNKNSNSRRSKIALRPIMIFIHGGLFEFGGVATNSTEGSAMASFGDAVIVTFNYRLNAFGWLNLDIPDADGNQGLYDIVTAIEWVTLNARAFGGDASKITLFGHSAGGICIGWLMASPKFSHLVQRVIFQSGVPIIPPLIFDLFNSHRHNMASFVGCDFGSVSTFYDDPEKVLQCLKSLPAERFLRDIIDEVQNLDLTTMSNLSLSSITSNPLMYLHFPSINDDFPRSPWQAIMDMAESKSPHSHLNEIILGYNREEASFVLPFLAPDIFNISGDVQLPRNLTTIDTFSQYMTNYVLQRFPMAERFKSEISSLIKLLIRREPVFEPSPFNFVKRGIKFVTKILATCPIKIMAEELNRFGVKSFLYQFSHWSESSPWPEWIGAPHGQELKFVFGKPIKFPTRFTIEDIELSQRLIKTWINFGSEGKPIAQNGQKWPQYDPNVQKVMDLSGYNASLVTENDNRLCDIYRIVLDIPDFDLARIRSLVRVILPQFNIPESS